MYTFQTFGLGLIKRLFFSEPEEESTEESRDELLARLAREYDEKDTETSDD